PARRSPHPRQRHVSAIGVTSKQMDRRRNRWLGWRAGVVLGFVAAAASGSLHAQSSALAHGAQGAKTWIGRTPEIERYLQTATITGTVQTSVGVTRPQHAFLERGGPFTELLWKPLSPGIYGGYRESYAHEIAAYELDKL